VSLVTSLKRMNSIKSLHRNPIMTGTSVIALKFDKGIMMAADTLGSSYLSHFSLSSHKKQGSYGSLARFRDIRRLQSVGSHTVIGAGGDLSDWQQIQHLLSKLMYVFIFYLFASCSTVIENSKGFEKRSYPIRTLSPPHKFTSTLVGFSTPGDQSLIHYGMPCWWEGSRTVKVSWVLSICWGRRTAVQLWRPDMGTILRSHY
jgi:hypothetical protein